jgi:ABC-type bacteriocin/lantibiotic exporter with double-glycine peptidase domain
MNYQRQTFNNCGPASVAILLGYYDHQVTQQEVNEHLPAGSVEDLLSYLSEYQLTARGYDSPPSREAVRHLLANRIPVIVNQWLFIDSDLRHYRVIKGYDDVSREFISDDPLQGADLRIGYDVFIKLSRPGEIIPVYPPEMDALVQSLMGELGMHECPI